MVRGAASRLSNTQPSNGSDWFNNRRLLEHNANIPPAEAEANFYAP